METPKVTVREVTGIEQPIAQVDVPEIKVDAPVVETPVVEPPKVELKDEELLDLVSKKLNKPVTSFDDLVKEKDFLKEELPEDVATFLKYKKETGRGLEDFTKLNRDFKAMDPNEKLFEYLSVKEEGLDKDDILSMMDEFKPVEIDEDLDTEQEILDKKSANQKKARDKKKTLNEADKFFEKQKETYKVPLVSSSVPDAEKEEFEAFKTHKQNAKGIEERNAQLDEVFNQKTDEVFSKEFKGFEFKVKVGEEEKTIVFTPGTGDELKSVQTNPMNFFKKFMDDKGVMQDVKGYHRQMAVAMNPEKFAQHFIDQGYAMAVESNDKSIKNINMGVRTSPAPLARNGIKVTEVGPPPVNKQNISYSGKLTVKK